MSTIRPPLIDMLISDEAVSASAGVGASGAALCRGVRDSLGSAPPPGFYRSGAQCLILELR